MRAGFGVLKDAFAIVDVVDAPEGLIDVDRCAVVFGFDRDDDLSVLGGGMHFDALHLGESLAQHGIGAGPRINNGAGDIQGGLSSRGGVWRRYWCEQPENRCAYIFSTVSNRGVLKILDRLHNRNIG